MLQKMRNVMGRITLRASLSLVTVSLALATTPAFAANLPAEGAVPAADAADASADMGETIVVNAKTTRSATAIPAAEMQKILPGISPLKAIQSLPGVLYVTADPWGNNEQNAQMFVHGFRPSNWAIRWMACRWATRTMAITTAFRPARADFGKHRAHGCCHRCR
jgi:outer membrane receptor protein involved in Fe transport